MTSPPALLAPVRSGASCLRNLISNRESEIPCRVSSDLHEWRNDLDAVSTRGSVKLQSR
jgi:hypothetical protein